MGALAIRLKIDVNTMRQEMPICHGIVTSLSNSCRVEGPGLAALDGLRRASVPAQAGKSSPCIRLAPGATRRVCFAYAPALAARASGGVGRASADRPKYNRYDWWIPYITGKATRALCQPKWWLTKFVIEVKPALKM